MKVAELIRQLQELNTEYFMRMKDQVPMGYLPPEAVVSIEYRDIEDGEEVIMFSTPEYKLRLSSNGIKIVVR